MFFGKVCKRIAYLIILILNFCHSSAQDHKREIDSLFMALSKPIHDTQRINLLLGIVRETNCEDSMNKMLYSNKAMELAKKNGWEKGIVKSKMTLGNIYYGCRNDYVMGLTYYLDANALANKINDEFDKPIILNTIATLYQRMGQYSKAINYYRQELTFDLDFDKQIGIWGNLGVEYNQIGDYNNALNCYFNSLKILNQFQKSKNTRDIKDTIQVAGLILNIGDMYMALDQHSKALENYDSVYKTGVKVKDKRVQVLGLMGIGKTWQVKKDYDRSIEVYTTALNSSKSINDIEDETKILNELAICYLGKNEPAKALEYAQSALGLAKEKSNNEHLPKIYITLGRAYLALGNYSTATGYLQQALTISQTTGALEDEKETWAALSTTFKRQGQPAKALDAYEHYITIRDSVYNVARVNEFTRQELDFSYKNKELADKLNYDKKMARQQLFTYGGFTGLALVLLLAFFIYRNYNIQRKYNELLSREKQGHLDQIKEQDTVLMDIAHIQSHKVRGPIATILGLVQIFNHDDPTDPVNKEVIEGVAEVTGRLDVVVKEVVQMENRIRNNQDNKNRPQSS